MQDITKFEELLNLDIKDKTETKRVGNKELTYLSWSDAIEAFTKAYPEYKYEVKLNEQGMPYFADSKVGYMVFTSITVGEDTKVMWLPVLNYSNKAVKGEECDMAQINKTIMRCLVKNMAMFGLGLKIYQGEDLPEESNKKDTESKKEPEETNEKKIEQVKKLQEKLCVTDDQQKAILHKNFAKDKLEDLTKLELDKVIVNYQAELNKKGK